MPHSRGKKLSLFWFILAGMYLILSIVSFIRARKQNIELKNFKGRQVFERGSNSEFDVFKNLSKYFYEVGCISFGGFLLAAIAALYASGILDKILELIK